MSELVATKCRRATIALLVASRLFHIARLARIARWSMVPDDAGNSRRRIIRPQSLAGILLSSSTIFFQLSYLWSLPQNILKIKVPPENCHLHGNQEVFYCQSGKLPYMPYLANFRRTICHFKWLITIVEFSVTE